MALVDTKQQKINPFEKRKKEFFEIIQKNGILKLYLLIGLMNITLELFKREYKVYLEAFEGIIQYDEKTQMFLYNASDIVFDYDGCTGRPEGLVRKDYQEKLVA